MLYFNIKLFIHSILCRSLSLEYFNRILFLKKRERDQKRFFKKGPTGSTPAYIPCRMHLLGQTRESAEIQESKHL